MSCAFLHSYGAVCDACVWCQSACAVHRPNGTRARNAPFRIAPAPLRNRQIAFGSGRFPVRRISHRCVPRGPLRALRFARALDCFAICAGSLRNAARFSGASGVPRKRISPSARRYIPPHTHLSSANRNNASVAGYAEPGAEAVCLFYGTPGMSHAKRCADKGVANEGRDP